VTMHEPGCSRLVTVDVEQAVALAEAWTARVAGNAGINGDP